MLRYSRLKYLTEIKFEKAKYCTSSLTVHAPLKKKSTNLARKQILADGPDLKEFLVVGKNLPKIQNIEQHPYLKSHEYSGNGRKVFFEVYGCQMNVNDTEVVYSILKSSDYVKCSDIAEADVILLITCAIRESAETKIWNRLKHLQVLKSNRSRNKEPVQIGILGCMAERLKTQVLEKVKWVDVVAGPDSYKDLPRLLKVTQAGQSAVNVLLSLDETYADVMPVRLNSNSITAFVSIMRGCDNMCSYCIVPFTRGKERSRPISSIQKEVISLAENGIKEVTLLGQNVNSYRDTHTADSQNEYTKLAEGFKTVYKNKLGGLRFAELIRKMAEIAPEVRFRFTSPHPKDFPDDVLYAIKEYPNICKSIHLPAQSGNSAVLERMRRGYTRESYIKLVNHIRTIIPEVSLSSDFICGFCGETDEEFNETISLIKEINYNVAYLFPYSMREKTTAHRRYIDDVPENIKLTRLQEMIKAFRSCAEKAQAKFIGRRELILVEDKSKRSDKFWFGRNDANIKVIIPDVELADKYNENFREIRPGDYISVDIKESSSQVLKGQPIYRTTLQQFYR